MYFGRVRIAEGVSKQKSHPLSIMLNEKHVIFRLVVFHLTHAAYAYKNYWLCDRCDRDSMMKKSAAINDVKT